MPTPIMNMFRHKILQVLADSELTNETGYRTLVLLKIDCLCLDNRKLSILLFNRAWQNLENEDLVEINGDSLRLSR